jgi:acyl-CoA reductase-like NAD-dependent aldehyde dehydrogenase
LAETTTQAARRIRVEDPATGRLTAIVDVVAPEHIPELVARARAAQPGWDALGFEGRNELFGRAQKWMVDNRERVIRAIVSETGKAWEEAQLAELAYVAGALGSGESTRARSSRRRRCGPRRPSSWAASSRCATPRLAWWA